MVASHEVLSEQEWFFNLIKLLTKRGLTEKQRRTIIQLLVNREEYNQNVTGHKLRTLKSLQKMGLVYFDEVYWSLTYSGKYISDFFD